jgi:hypothetical protein
MKLYIRYLRFIGQTRRSDRLVQVGLSNGAVVKIVSCYEGWQQYNATVEEKKVAMPIAERFNDWLHGGKYPY